MVLGVVAGARALEVNGGREGKARLRVFELLLEFCNGLEGAMNPVLILDLGGCFFVALVVLRTGRGWFW